MVLTVCACNNNQLQTSVNDTLTENDAAAPTPETSLYDNIFSLKNNCGKDAYFIEFVKDGSEPLIIDGVLPFGNEVKVSANGKCTIKADFLNDDGSYSNINFGVADLDSASTIILDTDDTNFFISYE